MGFTILTWNINGLRSFGGAQQWNKIFQDFNRPDIVCFQETKISRSSLEKWMALVDGYTSYFSFVDCKHLQRQSGYSGVASFVRKTSSVPSAAEVSFVDNVKEIFSYQSFDHLEQDSLFWSKWRQSIDLEISIDDVPWSNVDSEGRCVVTKHAIQVHSKCDEVVVDKCLYVFNVYCPRNDPTKPERQVFQLKFYHMLQKRIEQLMSNTNNHVILLGDLNTAHRPIDVYCDDEFCYAESLSRCWLDQLLNDSNSNVRMVDAFRHLHPNDQNEFTCWNTQIGARQTNYGSRIDYILIDETLSSHLIKCHHLSDYVGSDHCPVLAEFDNSIQFIGGESSQSLSDQKLSSHCTQLWPEFNQNKANSIVKYLTTIKPPNPTNQQKTTINKRPKITQQPKMEAFLTAVKKVKRDSQQQDSTPSSSQDNHSSTDSAAQWKQLFTSHSNKLLSSIPNCSGHNLPCVKKKVRKPGPNFGREFYQCSKIALKPEGHPETKCNYFKWIS